MIDNFISHFNPSDAGAIALHCLLKNLLPKNNLLPTGYSYVSKVKERLKQNKRFFETGPKFTTCILHYRFRLKELVEKNLKDIEQYAIYRYLYPSVCENLVVFPPPDLNNSRIVINLILFTDGVKVKKSTMKKGLWPLWIQVADLPPKIRMARKNLVLAGLLVGEGTPNWTEIVRHLKAELMGPIEISGQFQVTFKFRIIIADLVAKASVLNMYKFNGFSGCHFCDVPGKTIGKTHSYYPYGVKGKIREPCVNERYVQMAERLNRTRVANVVGVKGRSPFSSIVEGLPLSAPVDYMHCILIGVFPEVLQLLWSFVSTSDKISIENMITNFACPREVIAYSRKIRSIKEINDFKANEFFNWLFYIAPIVFYGKICREAYRWLVNFSFGIRILLETSDEPKVNLAEVLLNDFCKNVVHFFGDEKKETINFHCVTHLAYQVRKIGPLFVASAMSPESANRYFGEVLTGSRNECEVITRRMLQKYFLTMTDFEDTDTGKILEDMLSNTKRDENFKSFMKYTSDLIKGMEMFSDSEFFNRFRVGSTVFDSLAYERRNGGNDFVSWEKNGQLYFGQILYFVQIDEFSNEGMHAVVRFYELMEHFGPVRNYMFIVRKTSSDNLVSAKNLKQVLAFELSDSKFFVSSLCSAFEHS